jgi:hypothetical protein
MEIKSRKRVVWLFFKVFFDMKDEKKSSVAADFREEEALIRFEGSSVLDRFG